MNVPRSGDPIVLGVLTVGALVAGATTTLAFPPGAVPVLGLVGTAVGLAAMAHAGSARRGALVGLGWGLGFAALLFRWTLELDLLAYVALAPAQAAFWAATGAAVATLAKLSPGWWVLGTAGVWTVVEALRARVPFGGFEWGQLGLATADVPVRHGAAVLGALGVTGLVVAVAAGLASLVTPGQHWRNARSWRPLGAAVLVLGSVTAVGVVPWTTTHDALTVAVVQVDDPCPGEFAVDCPGLRQEIMRGLAAGTDALDTEPDLVLWGEGSLRGDTPDDAGSRLVEAHGALPAPLLAGTNSPEPPGRFHNRNVLYDPQGRALDWYGKRHPVPFGEYVPFRDLVGGLADVGRLVPSDMVPGEDVSGLAVPTDEREVVLGSVVSWEVTFARLVRDAAAAGEAVTTLTTQASYGRAPVSDQLLGAAQLRAVETGRAMVVAATTGRSTIIQPDGTSEETTALFAADELEGTVALRGGTTPYALWGDGAAIVLAGLAAAAAAWRLRRGPARQVASERGAEPAVAEHAPG